MNRLEIVARIVEISTIRYSPAGLPVVDAQLEHESTVEEAGIQRKTHLLLKSIALGILAEKLTKLPVENSFKFSGFLASSQKSKSIVFHIQSIQTEI